VALAAVMGSLAQELIDAIVGNSSLSQATGITSHDASDGFLAFTQVYLALIACGYLVQAWGTLRHEETSGRLEPMLAGTVGRPRWLAAQLVVTLSGLALMVGVTAFVLGATTALSTGGSGYLPTVVGAGVAYLPAELVVAGVAVLLYGLAPRAFPLAWAVFGAVTFIGLLGSGLQLPQWVLDLSPLTHVGNPPEGEIDSVALAWLTFLATVITVVAFAGFRRRRVPQG
jgi:ABC-2 type transport system permease protein